ncbi:MAG: hypothetical protein Q7K54_04655 [Candidatus Parcubacteria bacterium]|nr:hypothetical protein [Candidatus Parcubacteria bacterium]
MNESMSMGPSPKKIINESNNVGPSPEEAKRLAKEAQDKEDTEWEADYLARHPKPETSPETSRDIGPEIVKLEELVALFEANHSLVELNAIIDLSPDLATLLEHADDLESEKQMANTIARYKKDGPEYEEKYKKKIEGIRAIVLTPEDAIRFKIKRVAKKDLIPITEILRVLKSEINFSSEKYNELKIRCSKIVKAIGRLVDGKISHD